MADRKDGSQWSNYLWFGGQLVGMTRSGVLYQIDNDHLGRPELITNASKALVWRSNNSPFGGMTPDSANTLTDFNIGFPGQYLDAESGLWYNMNRYYDAELGRYLQADPIGLAGGLNRYVYGGGNPVSHVDPSGLVTVVVINNNTPIIGSHAGLYTSHSVFGGRMIYDPSGGYKNDTRGSAGIFDGKDASLSDYLKVQLEDGGNVQTYSFNTTPDEENEISQRAIDQGDPRGAECATYVSEAIKGIGPFQSLGTYITPNGLGAALNNLTR